MDRDEFARLPIRHRVALRQAEQARECAVRAPVAPPPPAPAAPAAPVVQCWRPAAGAALGAFAADLLVRLF